MRRSRAAITALLVCVLLAAAATSAAAAPSPSPSPSASPSPGSTPSPIPSTDAIAKEVQRQQRVLAAERARLATSAQSATATLQAYQQRRREAADAAREARAQADRAAAARVLAAEARSELQDYAGALYRTGAVGTPLLIVTASLESNGPYQFLNGLRVAQKVASTRGRIVTGLAEAEAEEQAAAAEARRAQARQAAAEARAATANAEATKVVDTYRKQVAERQASLAVSTGTLRLARERDRKVEAARDIARAAGWTETPSCLGQDLSGYPNGEIPLDAMCPVLFTTGHRLRADAAYAFNAMAMEYAGAFAAPLCVTDSYRSYDAQVRVAEEKPTLAAAPGHSNHGWGLATDLCGGIEQFDTPTHQWMLDNAPRFGWFHPAWAEPDGGKPEPWHWEFAG